MSLVLLDKLLLKAISLLPPASTTGGQQRGCGGGGREKGGVTRVVRVIEPMPLDEVLLAPFVDSLQRSMRGTHRGEGEENLLLLLLLSLRLSLRLDSPGIKNGTNLQQEGTIDSGDTGSTTERGRGEGPHTHCPHQRLHCPPHQQQKLQQRWSESNGEGEHPPRDVGTVCARVRAWTPASGPAMNASSGDTDVGIVPASRRATDLHTHTAKRGIEGILSEGGSVKHRQNLRCLRHTDCLCAGLSGQPICIGSTSSGHSSTQPTSR